MNYIILLLNNCMYKCYIKLIMKDKKDSRYIYDKIVPVKVTFNKE